MANEVEQYKMDGRSKRIKWETSKQLIPAKPRKAGSRPVKPSGPEHKYFETIAWSEEGSRRVKCNYCPHELWANTSRMRHHTVNNCLGDVPDEVKLELTLREGDLESKKLKEIKKQVIKTRSKISNSFNSVTTSRLSDRTLGTTGTFSDRGSIGAGSRGRDSGSDDNDDGNDDGDDEERVAMLLKSLIGKTVPKNNNTNNCSRQSTPSSGHGHGHKVYTDEEYTNITRELTIQKMKMELDLMQDQKRIISKLSKGLDTITKAANLWIEKEERESQSTNLTVYTDGDTYLTDQSVTTGQTS